MTEDQFEKLDLDSLILPHGGKKTYKILTKNIGQGLLELDEKGYMSDSSWYRFENVDIIIPQWGFRKEDFSPFIFYKKIS